MMPEKRKLLALFVCVLILGFAAQEVMRSMVPLYDHILWTDEVRYFVTHDDRQYDFNGAYGNPGTPMLELGSILNRLGVSYENSVILSVNIFVAVAAAGCSVICFVLRPDSLWWLAAACTLLLNRSYPMATPPTMVAIPVITFIVLASCWFLNEREVPAPKFFLGWGAAVGFALATRYEIALFVGVPFSLLIAYRRGWKTLLPMIAGMIFAFILANPYMWYMPVRYLGDLVRRFTINYMDYPKTPLFTFFFVNTAWLAGLSMIWCVALLVKKRLPGVLPSPAIILLTAISLALPVIVSFSHNKAARYFFPLTVTWEVIFSLLVLEVVPPAQTVPRGWLTGVRWVVLSIIIGLLAGIQFNEWISLDRQQLCVSITRKFLTLF
jgi:hypothetical protein